MLKRRVITALWGIPLIVLAVWFDEPIPWFTVLAAVWGIIAVLEFYRMTGISKMIPLTCVGVIWTLLFILAPHCEYEYIIPFILISAIIVSLVMLLLPPKKEGIFSGWAWVMGGILYVGWLLGILVELRIEAGRDWLFLVLFVTFGSDTAAFFIGRAVGKHKLAPKISPNKTWEGAIAGVIVAVIISLLFTLPTPLELPLGYGHAILLGVLVSVFGQFGDLVESLLKRNTGVKDSGGLMPGHGGLLDRMDSVIFAGVVVYLYNIFAVA